MDIRDSCGSCCRCWTHFTQVSSMGTGLFSEQHLFNVSEELVYVPRRTAGSVVTTLSLCTQPVPCIMLIMCLTAYSGLVRKRSPPSSTIYHSWVLSDSERTNITKRYNVDIPIPVYNTQFYTHTHMGVWSETQNTACLRKPKVQYL